MFVVFYTRKRAEVVIVFVANAEGKQICVARGGNSIFMSDIMTISWACLPFFIFSLAKETKERERAILHRGSHWNFVHYH